MGQVGASSQGYHELEALFRCEFEWVAKNLRGIVPSGQVETPQALAQGLVTHAGRAVWFESGFKTDDATQQKILEALRSEGAKQPLPISPDDEQKAMQLFAAYQNHWKYLPNPTPLFVEYEIAPTEVVPGYTRTARLDDVSVYPDAGLCLGEAKTTSGSIDQLVAFYEMHGQPMLQHLLWKKSPQGEAKHGPINGIMLDIIGKPGGKRKGYEFARVLISVNDHMTRWFEDSLAKYLSVRDELMSGRAPHRNPAACQRFGAGGYAMYCPYRDLCKHGRAASGEYQFKDGTSLLDYKGEVAPWD